MKVNDKHKLAMIYTVVIIISIAILLKLFIAFPMVMQLSATILFVVVAIFGMVYDTIK